MKKKITKEQVHLAYELALQVNQKKISREDAIENLVNILNMNSVSAGDYIQSIQKMLKGECYKRTINAYATEYYLEKIANEFGVNFQNLAIVALRKHLDYFQSLPNGGPQKKHRKILNKYTKENNTENSSLYPDEIHEKIEILTEGAKKTVTVNAYEREPKAREKCLEIYGYNCKVCEMNFENLYGQIGKEFIHVHHTKEISSVGQEYEINPKTDLVPVCPNCHAMLHRKKPAYKISELIDILRKQKN